jgi:mannose-6-phosphate isomerase-like protein (cupin superfamily)
MKPSGGRTGASPRASERRLSAWRRDGAGNVRTHEGYKWLCVLAGRTRLILADHDSTMEPGEAAEFDTRLPHWFGAAGEEPVEILSLLSRQSERIHVRAAARSKAN